MSLPPEGPADVSENNHPAPTFSSGARGGYCRGMEQDTPQDIVADQAETTENVVAEELLVEEISIDGMCGVY